MAEEMYSLTRELLDRLVKLNLIYIKDKDRAYESAIELYEDVISVELDLPEDSVKKTVLRYRMERTLEDF